MNVAVAHMDEHEAVEWIVDRLHLTDDKDNKLFDQVMEAFGYETAKRYWAKACMLFNQRYGLTNAKD